MCLHIRSTDGPSSSSVDSFNGLISTVTLMNSSLISNYFCPVVNNWWCLLPPLVTVKLNLTQASTWLTIIDCETNVMILKACVFWVYWRVVPKDQPWDSLICR